MRRPRPDTPVSARDDGRGCCRRWNSGTPRRPRIGRRPLGGSNRQCFLGATPRGIFRPSEGSLGSGPPWPLHLGTNSRSTTRHPAPPRPPAPPERLPPAPQPRGTAPLEPAKGDAPNPTEDPKERQLAVGIPSPVAEQPRRLRQRLEPGANLLESRYGAVVGEDPP